MWSIWERPTYFFGLVPACPNCLPACSFLMQYLPSPLTHYPLSPPIPPSDWFISAQEKNKTGIYAPSRTPPSPRLHPSSYPALPHLILLSGYKYIEFYVLYSHGVVRNKCELADSKWSSSVNWPRTLKGSLFQNKASRLDPIKNEILYIDCRFCKCRVINTDSTQSPFRPEMEFLEKSYKKSVKQENSSLFMNSIL